MDSAVSSFLLVCLSLTGDHLLKLYTAGQGLPSSVTEGLVVYFRDSEFFRLATQEIWGSITTLRC